jgi:hypothetical protein
VNPDSNPTQNATWSTNIYSNDLVSSINFQNVGSQYNRTKAGFAINSGSGNGDAQPLTRTTNNGLNGRNLIVQDAGFFYDGWGIDGEAGDYIRIGSTTVQVQSVNWTNNTITLADDATWSTNDPVYYAGNPGNGNAGVVFDNRGAAQ